MSIKDPLWAINLYLNRKLYSSAIHSLESKTATTETENGQERRLR